MTEEVRDPKEKSVQIEAMMKFHLNRDPRNSKYTGTYDGLLVFASPDLDEIIEKACCEAETILVSLERHVRTRHNEPDFVYYVANLHPEVAKRKRKFLYSPPFSPYDKSFGIIIDGANFILSIIKQGLRPEDVLKNIMNLFKLKANFIRIYYSDYEIQRIIPEFEGLLGGIPNITAIKVDDKVIAKHRSGHPFTKTIVDSIIAAGIMSEAAKVKTVKTLVFCGGDSDLVEASYAWLGISHYNDYSHFAQNRQIMMVSSRQTGNISQQARELANQTRGHILFIEDI